VYLYEFTLRHDVATNDRLVVDERTPVDRTVGNTIYWFVVNINAPLVDSSLAVQCTESFVFYISSFLHYML